MMLPIWSDTCVKTRRDTLLLWQQTQNWRQCWRDMAALGPESYIQFGSSLQLRQVIHDLRGGPLTSLVLALSTIEHDPEFEADFEYVWLMARDVRKIARNCFPDLDPTSFKQDQLDVGHAAQLMVEKWTKVHCRGGVSVKTEFEGNIAQSCVEFSALDRVLYNLMNNAIRGSAHSDDPVRLRIMTKDKHTYEIARFWISNTIDETQSRRLKTTFGDDMTELFATNFSTTGSGLGMQIVADFVSKAFGVNTAKALGQSMLGAIVTDCEFHAWFHWPVAD
jgi:K+-sensing histidine kinase KdpD